MLRQGTRVFLERDDLNQALPGDLVELEAVAHRRGQDAARVRRIVERRTRPLLGQVVRRRGGLEFRPYRADTADAMVFEDPAGLSPGDQLSVVRMPPVRRGDPARARVVERLGRADEPRWDSLMVALDAGLPLEFPPDALEQAERAAVPPRGVPRGRTDLREPLTVTIDPPDAKDHDDALSLVAHGSSWELGVHIADVASYVRPGTALDEEALRRGNSTYLPDMVLPMLPEALSSNVCSLKPGVNRLALSVLVRVDGQGRPQRHRIVASVIRSDHRLSYEQAERILQGDEPAPEDLRRLLEGLSKVTSLLKAARLAQGSLDLDLPETRVTLDPSGAPLELHRHRQRGSHQLVEECMILANRTVGLEAAERNFRFLYRIHEEPLEARLAEFAQLAEALGLHLPDRRRRGEDWVRHVNLRQSSEVKRKLIQTLLLRSLSKARYSPDDVGHYGLAVSRYAHFTSPIRRYPDLANHRQVHRWIAGEPSDDSEDYAAMGDQCTETEIRSMNAEREAVTVKCVRFMEPRVGEDFPAVVTGMIRSGFFVELVDFPVEGMVRFAGLHEDHFVWEPERALVRGRRTGAVVRLGDELTVRLVRADLEARQLEFAPAEPLAAPAGRGARGRRPRPQ
ncbi:MAG: VacB/RNase II family 3'-5' exoribonuclease [Candidatus Eisenbacteria bacterium]|nr:VacB/RNase II family 3'-5' exoribonuclease [Candidatus Eisenbacteria bacterium]